MECNNILEALSLASKTHKDQRRKADDSPYINHLIEVAFLLTRFANVSDYKIIQATLFHDILEDTEVTEEVLADSFGTEVLSYVRALTDDKRLSLEKRRIYQIEHISEQSNAIKLIKLADHCSNIASIPPSWNLERVKSYLDWSYQVASQCFDASQPLAAEYKIRYLKSRSE